MGFLDKLLGRDRTEAPEAPARPEAAAAGDPAAEPAEHEPSPTERRDESLGLEGRIPPGEG